MKTCERDGCDQPVSLNPKARFCSEPDCKRARNRDYAKTYTGRRDPTRGRIRVAGPAHPCLHCGRPCVRLNARVCKDKACRALATLARGKARRATAPPQRYHGPPRPCEECGQPMKTATPGGRICGPQCKPHAPMTERARQAVAARRRRFTCRRCGVSFLGSPGTSKTRFCSEACRFPAPEPVTESAVPFAACLGCRSWFVARVGRKKCPSCTPKSIWRALGLGPTVPCTDCGLAVPQPLGGGRRERCDRCRADRARVASRASGRRSRANLSPDQRRELRKRYKRRRRAARRGVQSEPYTLAEIAGRDGWRCHICQGAVPERLLGKAGYHPKGPSIDHLVPLALGGDDIRANVALAHHRCNSLKGATLPVAGVQLQLLAA